MLFITDRLCVEHTREYEANRLKPKCKLLPPLPTADTILCGLSHYVKNNHNQQHYSRKDGNLVPATADELLQQMEKDKNIVVDPFGTAAAAAVVVPPIIFHMEGKLLFYDPIFLFFYFSQ